MLRLTVKADAKCSPIYRQKDISKTNDFNITSIYPQNISMLDAQAPYDKLMLKLAQIMMNKL